MEVFIPFLDGGFPGAVVGGVVGGIVSGAVVIGLIITAAVVCVKCRKKGKFVGSLNHGTRSAFMRCALDILFYVVVIHGSLECMVNNHPTPKAESKKKGGYCIFLNRIHY